MFSIIILCLFACLPALAQQQISGTVFEGKRPLMGVNVFIQGTIDGCLTDSLGRFSFTTDKTDSLTLKATCIGFEDYVVKAQANQLHNLKIKMKEQERSLDEVVVTASNFHFGAQGNAQSMNSVDVVTIGGSCGDIVGALQTLPGSQKVGEDGKLYVRGGSSDECQTFVNGMHVMQPYTTSATNTSVRGRFSPFLFKGINFSTGGYMGEYGQALSSVLEMNTTDVADHDKLGVSASMLDWNVGGTKAFKRSSLSFNVAFTSLALYEDVFRGGLDWTRPWRELALEGQYKVTTPSGNNWKTYVEYDLTSFGYHDDGRPLSMAEHNIYLNSTYHASAGHGWTAFAGVAQSVLTERIKNALANADCYNTTKAETHVKAKFSKSLTHRLACSLGAETYLRFSDMNYELSNRYSNNMSHVIFALNADGKLMLLPKLYCLFSARGEESTLDHRLLFLPKASLQYQLTRQISLNLTAGRYSQTVNEDLALRNNHKFDQTTATHYIIGAEQKTQKLMWRLEAYYKKYSRLPWMTNNVYSSSGYGQSKGVDCYVKATCWSNMDLTLSYSYCDASRLYLDYAREQMPGFVSRHNLRLNWRYSLGKFIFSLTESFASKRHVGNYVTPYYNSLDAAVTVLVNKRTILYTSLSNVLRRRNIYGLDNGKVIGESHRQFFYIGIFLTLKGNKAYDISNF